jgi:hypothetical protein
LSTSTWRNWHWKYLSRFTFYLEFVLILAAVAVLGAEEVAVWDLNHRAQARFWTRERYKGFSLVEEL